MPLCVRAARAGSGCASGISGGPLASGAAGDDDDDDTPLISGGAAAISPAKRSRRVAAAAAAAAAVRDPSPARAVALYPPAASANPSLDPATVDPVLDSRDFTTWTPKTWALVDWSGISFPQNPTGGHRANKMFHAASIIFFYDDAMRTSVPTTYTELQQAWLENYGRDVVASDLDYPPNTGSGAYSDEEVAWCVGTIQSFRRRGGLRVKRKAVLQGPSSPSASDTTGQKSKHPKR